MSSHHTFRMASDNSGFPFAVPLPSASSLLVGTEASQTGTKSAAMPAESHGKRCLRSVHDVLQLLRLLRLLSRFPLREEGSQRARQVSTGPSDGGQSCTCHTLCAHLRRRVGRWTGMLCARSRDSLPAGKHLPESNNTSQSRPFSLRPGTMMTLCSLRSSTARAGDPDSGVSVFSFACLSLCRRLPMGRQRP